MSLSKYLFHHPDIMKLLGKRGDALKAVRQSKGVDDLLGEGASLEARAVGNKVVKNRKPNAYDSRNVDREMNRRTHLKSIANDADLAPETFLVDTSKKRYMVQDKVDPDLEQWMPGTNIDDIRYGSGSSSNLRSSLEDVGITSDDIYGPNISAYTPDRYQAIDLGQEKMTRAVKPEERAKALQHFIQKNRKKDWL